jgi:hypothetical protein
MASAFLTITNLAASSVADFMLGADQGASNLRFIKGPKRVTYAADATAAEAELEVFSGARTVQERSLLDAGGTAGVVPNLQQKAQSFLAADGEVLQFRVRETAAAGTVDCNLFVSVDPI